jgi:hypothetical protein
MTAGSIVVAVLAAGVATSFASAEDLVTSAYTHFNSARCQHEAGTEEEDYGSWLCPGYGGLSVLLSAGDQRMYVTYGPWRGDDVLALAETFSGFNDVYQGTVEWRLEKDATGKSRPFATILRWNVMNGDDHPDAGGRIHVSGRVLVVTRLGPGGVCHVGYVDARANPGANALARKLADNFARSFRCGKDKRIVLGAISRHMQMPKDEE